LGIFVPSWFRSPVRTAYRYLQHWMLHPYLWRYLEQGRLRSWGAKSIQESGRHGEPFLTGNGYARIGEGSGSTNVLAGAGVDEAWITGTQLAEAVVELLEAGRPFSRDELEATYVRRRRESAIESGSRIAKNARTGFHRGALLGLAGTVLAALTKGRVSVPRARQAAASRPATLEEFFGSRVPVEEISRIRRDCELRGVALHDVIMERVGWPPIPYDGQLLVSHQDALLAGGKVRAPAGYADHVLFHSPQLCEQCPARVCIEICSGEAITPGAGGVPAFDREKCVHCGACSWSCVQARRGPPGRTNIEVRASAGGLHSVEN
jgi:electron-transferring-flavoprotein dehydrogenase